MTDGTRTHTAPRRLNLGAGALIGLTTLGLSILVAVAVGTVSIPLPTVVGVLVGKLMPGMVNATWTTGALAVVWEIRFPRALLGALVGAGLGLVGAALQAVRLRAPPIPSCSGPSLYRFPRAFGYGCTRPR